jgi:uncharacterized membrane protein YagU involved in acid resistance
VNVGSWMLWGFIATLTLSTMLATSQGLGLTRMNVPYMVGMMVTADRDRAKLYGFILHCLNGLVFSFLYVLVFQALHKSSWWIGSLLGLGHAMLILTLGMSLMPGLHPRMANERFGPTATRMLEPPGFMALNYGVQTPLSVAAAHVIFGIILGLFYQLK